MNRSPRPVAYPRSRPPRHRRWFTALLVLLVLAFSPLPALVPVPDGVIPAAVARKRDARQPRAQAAPAAAACEIKKSGSLWKLKADCTITAPITIPNGVTLDGDNKTITMTGAVSNFRQTVPDNWTADAGILATGGRANVRDLKVRGSGLTGACSPGVGMGGDLPEGIAFINTSGTIDGVTVTDVRISSPRACGIGISATGTGGQRVAIRKSTVSGSTSRAILALSREQTAGITVDVTKTTVTEVASPVGPGSGVVFSGPVSGSIVDTKIDVQNPIATGIELLNRGSLVARTVILRDITVTAARRGGIFVTNLSQPALHIDASRLSISTNGEFFVIDTFGLGLSGHIDAKIDRTTIRGTTYAAFSVNGTNAKVAIDRSLVETGNTGLEVTGGEVTVDDTTFRNVLYGVAAYNFGSGARVGIDDTVITGPKAPQDFQIFGVLFDAGTSGAIDDTAISGFFDTNPSSVSCGIGLIEGAGPVDIRDVSYPNPGNEQNLCDPVVFPEFAQATARDFALAAPDDPAELQRDLLGGEGRGDTSVKARGNVKDDGGEHRGRHENRRAAGRH